MNKLELTNFEVAELTNDELEDVNGGIFLAIAILVGIWVAMYLYDLYFG